MSIAARLWDRLMDQLLEKETKHKFDPRPVGMDAKAGRCVYCGKVCLDVMDEVKAGKTILCRKRPEEKT